MWLDIWMRCAGPLRVSPLKLAAWRVVEAQHKVSTRRLVDTLDEQAVLEDIVDEVKPRRPGGAEFQGLHYLLSTPFRYPPLLRGSRFGSPSQRGIWYGAERVETSLAEKAYYQLLFLEGTKEVLKNLSCDWSAFAADIQTTSAIDLTVPPFDEFSSEISSPSSYAATQPLGSDMRAAGVVAFGFRSARCALGGKAFGLFTPAFTELNPGPLQTWRCLVTTMGCEAVHLNGTAKLVFDKSAFVRGKTFPAPGISS
jgi:hypothetical protein